MAFCVMNVAKFSGPDMASGGLEDEWLREPGDEPKLKGSLSSNIDWTRTGLNYELDRNGNKHPVGRCSMKGKNGPERVSVDGFALKLYDRAQHVNEKKYGVKRRKMRKDATHVVSTVYSASPEFFAKHRKQDGTLDEVGEQYFRDCLAFDMEQGGELLKAVVHLDETTPHMHVIKAPVMLREFEKKQKDGTTVKAQKWTWSAKDLLGGRKQLSAAQTRFAKEVGRAYALERGEVTVAQDESTYVAGEVRHNKRKNPEQYRASLNDELEALEAKAKTAKAELETAQRKSAQLQQQVERFHEQKRLADNEEQRKDNAREERRKVQAGTEALRDEAKTLRAEVARLKDERKTLEPEVAPLRAERAQLLREVAPLREEKEHAKEDAQRIREQATREAGAIRAGADEYAEKRRTEADALLGDARQKAQSVGNVWDFLRTCVRALRMACTDDEWRRQGAMAGTLRKSAFLTDVLERFEKWLDNSNTRARYEDKLEDAVGGAFKPETPEPMRYVPTEPTTRNTRQYDGPSF